MMQAFKNKFINEERMKIVNIPLEILYPNPNQPRKVFDETALSELADSIRRYGVIQPITVRKTEKGYEIIAGERRYRACKLNGAETIPAIIINADNDKSAILALLENLQREDLCFFEIAEAYQNLIREQGMTQEELAKKVGKSQSTIANKLRLLKLSPRVKKSVRELELTERHARAILPIKNEDEQMKVLHIIYEKQLNVQQTEELVINILAGKEKPKKKRTLPSLRDIRIFTNTIKKALEVMEHNGLKTEMKKNDFDWGTEYVIKVENSDKT